MGGGLGNISGTIGIDCEGLLGVASTLANQADGRAMNHHIGLDGRHQRVDRGRVGDVAVVIGAAAVRRADRLDAVGHPFQKRHTQIPAGAGYECSHGREHT